MGKAEPTGDESQGQPRTPLLDSQPMVGVDRVGFGQRAGTGLPPCPTFKCRSLCDLVGGVSRPFRGQEGRVGETWYFLCILPSPWPRASQSPPPRIPPCSRGSPSPARPGCLAACPSLSLQLQSPLVHAVAEERGLQRFMKESQPGTFFLVHSALGLSVPGPARAPWTTWADPRPHLCSLARVPGPTAGGLVGCSLSVVLISRAESIQ